MHSAQTLLPDFVQNRQSNFYYSFLMLPKPKREAIETIYAFCRYTDDIVDEQTNEREQNARLKQWTRELHLSLRGASRYQILNKLSTVIQRFDIPLNLFYDLIKGMEMDLTKKRYKSFEELREYCYKAASTVGLICAEVFGYSNEKTKQYAINLGIALQLTNILRDLKADAKKGRIYIPLEDLRRFRYTQQELLNGEYNDRFVQLMKFECDRAREFFRKAKSYLAEEDKPLFTAARTMGNIYYLLLRRIEKANYDVFSSRIRLSPPLKMLVAMVLSLRSKAPKNLHQYIRAELPA